MPALPQVVPATSSALTLPLVLTIAVATVALVVVALYVRRARNAGELTGVTALASGVSAAGILFSALAVSLIIGGASSASAAPATSSSSVTSSVSGPASPSNDYQLATK